MLRLRYLELTIAVLLVGQSAAAQGTKADYERAAALRRQTQGKVLRDNIEPHWLEGGERFWYRRDGAGGAVQFVLVDANTGAKSPLFDADRLASALQTEVGAPVKSESLPIERLAMSGAAGAERASFTIQERDDQLWIWDLAAGTLSKGTAEQLTAFQAEQAPRGRGRGAGAARATGHRDHLP